MQHRFSKSKYAGQKLRQLKIFTSLPAIDIPNNNIAFHWKKWFIPNILVIIVYIDVTVICVIGHCSLNTGAGQTLARHQTICSYLLFLSTEIIKQMFLQSLLSNHSKKLLQSIFIKRGWEASNFAIVKCMVSMTL